MRPRGRACRSRVLRMCLTGLLCAVLSVGVERVRAASIPATTDDVASTDPIWWKDPSGKWHNCTPAAIEQFPRPFMRPEVRRAGGLCVHAFVATLTFLGLAIICDEYFVPSLEHICDSLSLKPDVAGATFMAAGSSAPELATSVIAVFITKDDIGVGTVVGSAVFNIMFVVGICGLYTTKVLLLDWWPLTRDCIFYLISIFALLFAIYDEVVTWYESVVFLLLYASYCTFMYYNTEVEVLVKRFLGLNDGETDPLVDYDKVAAATNNAEANKEAQTEVELYSKRSEESVDSLKIQGADDEDSVISWPRESLLRQILYLVTLPLLLAFYVTVPDCRKRRWHRWYIITFSMSMLWLSALSYILVWMITVIGYTLGVPDTVMGLTLLAAGVSVPDAIASLLVVKDGLGDMAVSNAIGSNVFDILLCLGLPWFLQTVVISPMSTIAIFSKGLTYSTISLLSTVLFLLAVVMCNGWKLNRPLGAVLMIWYLMFMVLASLYELNFFGYFNPPTCKSNF